MNYKLDSEEKEILEAYESDNYQSIYNEIEKETAMKIAFNTLLKIEKKQNKADKIINFQ